MPNQSIFNKLKETNPDKYPDRIGQAWSEREEQELIKEIQQKVPIELIAELHERTEGSIRGRLRSIASDYYFNNKFSLEKIQILTGLSQESIHDTITRRVLQQKKKVEKETKVKATEKEEPLSDTKEIISLLKEIKKLLETVVTNISSNTVVRDGFFND